MAGTATLREMNKVIAIARHSETTEPMVVYKALYGDGGIWVRPAEMWNETIERDGKIIQRFEKTGYQAGT